MDAKLAGALSGSKRAAIMAKIREYRAKIAEARRIKTNMNKIDRDITNTIKRWTRQYASFQSSVMAPVVVTNKFEGDTAEKISAKLPEPIEKMDQIQSATENVQTEITVQIIKLEAYIKKLEAKIAALQAEMAGI